MSGIVLHHGSRLAAQVRPHRSAHSQAGERRRFMYRHILIATDGSELAQKAVDAGFALAQALKAKVTVVTATEPWSAMMAGEPALVFPIEGYEKAAAENAARILDNVNATAKAAGLACETVHVNDFPAEGIVETAK